MELQVVQARTLFVPVSGGRCEGCGEEEARQRLEKEARGQEALSPTDRVTLSNAAGSSAEVADENEKENGSGEEDPGGGGPAANLGVRTDAQLTAEEQRAVQDLRRRDQEVRTHEQAHIAAAGGYANSAPTFEYRTGPDGRRYAVGGEVSIDTSKVPGDPKATITKAQTIRRAALAPSEPSAQDRSVAAQASRIEAEARRELQKQKAEERKEAAESNPDDPASRETAAGGADASGSSANPAGIDAGNPLARRAIRGFEPAASTGNLLDVLF